MGPDLGGRFGTFVFCVFFVEYTLDCRDKYKYLKPLLAKWSRYYFTSLGGALTGGHMGAPHILADFFFFDFIQ